nr:turripeptide Ici9.2-like [Cherax quadricarinatus]XP_053648589.1 turripeptide Ici9.2-like [Cherax quadricarinatus]
MMIVRLSLLLVAVLVLQAEATTPPAQFSGRLCGRYCGRTLSPVCGSDGVTYYNYCMYENARCIHPGLTILYMGYCPGGAGIIGKEP